MNPLHNDTSRHFRYEWAAVVTAFAVYLVFQIHAAVFHGYSGQDWITHLRWIQLAANQPWEFFHHYTAGRTNPPIYDLLAAAVRRIVGLRHYLLGIGVMNALFGFVGVCFVYAAIRRLVVSPILRTAAIVFILFLPFAMIHAEVVASDALATPMFWVILWFLLRFPVNASNRAFGISTAVLAILLLFANQVKFTFGSVEIATAMWAITLWWTRQIPARRFAFLFAIAVIIPGAVTYRESVIFQPQQKTSMEIEPPAHLSEANMNPRSMVWLRPADIDVLYAPAYNWTADGNYKLLGHNVHSFPALMHLAMFTDSLNIYQYDPYDQYFGQRTLHNHHLMRDAVRTGLLFSVLALISVTTMLLLSTIRTVFQRDKSEIQVFTVALLSMGWFMNLFVLLPFVPGSYDNGWWLPRVYAPALIGFFVLSFVFLDRLKWLSKSLQFVVLAGVLVQVGLQVSFLWPTTTESPLYEPNGDIATAPDQTFLRVLTWQNGWNAVNPSGEYWMSKTAGIFINRSAKPPNSENWKLTFVLKSGPSLPTQHGVIRISAPGVAPRIVDFTGTGKVDMEIPLHAGPNDIRLELMDPEALEMESDTEVHMVQISNIEIRRG